ncbi:TRAP transporter small permease [Microbacterium sp. No. 7]|uniref:TRAP transporter small permease n=1 Tax=Microbacterium sp. No. 7 TaxID=1714373 RepID=UPI0006ED302D|nr:TRAP transporter small permease [Microbacterium sp. No. 7]ALJ18858.1 hypothetical protein AOA12_02600 [Microbacterium sp. No. 7]
MNDEPESSQYRAGRRLGPARWERVLEIVLLAPGALVLLVMLVYVVANAVTRTTLRFSLPASIELTQYWFMPLVAGIGFVGAQMVGQHVDADLFYGWFSDRAKRWLTICVRLFAAAFMLFWAWFALQEALYAQNKGIHAGYTDIPAWPAYFIIPLAFAGMAVILIIQAWRAWRSPADTFDESLEELMEEELKESLV